MGIFSNIWKAVTNPNRIFFRRFFNEPIFSTKNEQAKASSLISHYKHWVYTCASRNSTTVAATPLRLYVKTDAEDVTLGKQYKYLRKGRDTKPISLSTRRYLEKQSYLTNIVRRAVEIEEVVNHPFLDLWSDVNSEEEGFTMLEKLELFLELTGDSYLYVFRNELGIPQELWVLYPQYMKIVPDEKEFVKGYIYGSSPDREVAFDKDEIIHFKFPNPYEPYYGFSPLQGCLMAVNRKEEMDQYEASILHNFGRPDFVIKVKGRITDPDARALAERWKQLYGRRGKRGKPAILDNDAEVTKLGWGPREMAFLKGHKFTKEEIAGAYGVPVSKLTSEDVNRANADAGDYSWMKDAILPRLRRVAEKLSQKFLPMYDGRLFVAFDNPVPQDKAFELTKQETYLKNGVMSINQVRQQIGEEPVPWGESPWLSVTLAPVGSGSAPAEPDEDEDEEEMEEPKHLESKQGERPDFIRPPRPKLQEMQTTMQKIYREMEKDILQQVRAGQGAPELSWFHFDTTKWEKVVKRKMGPPIKQTLVAGGAHGIARLRSERSFDLTTASAIFSEKQAGFDINNPDVQRWLRSYVAHFSSVTTKNMGLRFSKNIARGFKEGETLKQLTARTEAFFKNMERTKALQIARSEASRALHHGMEFAWKQSGVVLGKEWLCNPG